MKLGEKGFNVTMRISIMCLLAIGVPKLFFVMQSHAQQDYSIGARESSTECNRASVVINFADCANKKRDGTRNYSENVSNAAGSGKHDISGTQVVGVNCTKTVALVTNQMHVWGTSSTMLERLIAQGLVVRTILVPFAYQTDLVRKKAKKVSFLAHSVSIITGETESLFSTKNLAGCDALCLDLQDTGVRTDGYVAVVYAALRAAREHDKELIIIDHPNPLGGTMEGLCSRSTDRDKETLFLARIPLRHGMTLGELALYMNRSLLSSPAHVLVVPLATYNRFTPVDARTLSASFSRNIRSLAACRCYSFLGTMGEVAPFDVALGTRYAFQALLLPEKKTISRAAWEQYRSVLKKHAIKSRLWRYYSKRKQRWFSGVRIFIPDGIDFSSTKVLMATLTFFKQRGVPMIPSAHIDQSVGSPLVRRFVAGELTWASGLNEVLKAKSLFFKEAFSACLYKPLPREVLHG
jgi:uncharacterized protein YbbC (DUF1343 family)